MFTGNKGRINKARSTFTKMETAFCGWDFDLKLRLRLVFFVMSTFKKADKLEVFEHIMRGNMYHLLIVNIYAKIQCIQRILPSALALNNQYINLYKAN